MNREGFIDIPSGKIWYRIVGVEKEGIPLLILHGGPGGCHNYLELLEVLSDQRPVIFYDQLGCGNSERPQNRSLWTVEHYVKELVKVRGALKLKTFHLLGHSWGTMLAAAYVLSEHPAGVVSLILSGPFLSAPRFINDQRSHLRELPEETQRTIIECEKSGHFNNPDYQSAMLKFYKKHVCRLDIWPECINQSFTKMGEDIYKYMWGPSEFTVTGTLQNTDLSDRLKEIYIPTLLTCGQYDEATPATTAYYQSLLPNSEMVIFENASHEHHLEKTELFLNTVRTFLNRIEEERKKHD
ncbi:MAG: proline iminopeptidase-family hydrolase [Candidatus Atribacteria bacterium]|nr:proline iminopeptidase-family hydrolase [Candidatus Atribacteria bacterium]